MFSIPTIARAALAKAVTLINWIVVSETGEELVIVTVLVMVDMLVADVEETSWATDSAQSETVVAR